MENAGQIPYAYETTLPALRDWDKLAALLPDSEELVYDPNAQPLLSQGRQSEVFVIADLEGGLVECCQVMWKRMAAHKGLTYEEARLLEANLRSYGNVLYEHGWRTPAMFATDIGEYEHGFGVVAAEQFIRGGDGEQLLKDANVPDSRKWTMVEDVMLTLYNPYTHGNLPRMVIAGKEVTALPYGLDLKPANVASDERGYLFVLDLFGPKLIGANGDWETYLAKIDSMTPENLRAVTASREGMVLRFWRLCEGFWNGEGLSPAERQERFLSLLPAVGAPDNEVVIIADEINQGYPWLDAIYAEQQV